MTTVPSRRTFLQASASAAAVAFLEPHFMRATPLNLPIGLQLYTVGHEMDTDPAGTLKAVAAAGYTAVELSPLAKTAPKELKKMLDDSGLKSPSGHYMLFDLLGRLTEMLDFAHMFGQQFMIVTVPWVADPSRFKPDPQGGEFALFMAIINGLTLNDWKWNAEQFNKVGEQVKKAGLQLGYHNHNFEWRDFDDAKGGKVTAYDEFLRLTDPQLVKLELDCGWATVAGQDPAAYLAKFPDRYVLLHIKDFHKGFTPRTSLGGNDPGAPVPTELGRGSIHYAQLLAAAKKAGAHLHTLFVEQEPPFTEMTALEAIKANYAYLRNLQV